MACRVSSYKIVIKCCVNLSAGGLWSVFTLGGAGSKAENDQEHNPLPLSNQSLLLLLVLANLPDGPDWPNPYRQSITCFRNTQGNYNIGKYLTHLHVFVTVVTLENSEGEKYRDRIVSISHCLRRHVVTACGAPSHLPDQFQQPVHSSVRAAAL